MAGLISRGFLGRRRPAEVENRLPPGQYLVTDWPVLSAGPTPHTPLDKWSFTMDGLVRKPVTWTWEEFQKLPTQTYTVDISCVTKWTKLDMTWLGVSVDTLLEAVEVDPAGKYAMAYSDGGYTTNVPLEEMTKGQAFIAYQFGDKPLEPVHGGPASAGRAASLFLEERQVDPWASVHGPKRARVLGTARLSHPWRSLERGAL